MNGPSSRPLPYALAFLGSLCIMVLELVAGRLVERHVGASLGVWTSVIGIMLGGICLGNVLGGKLADRVEPRRAVGPLYMLGGVLTLGALWVNAGVGFLKPLLDYLPYDLQAVLVVTLDFLAPTTALGMIGPVVAKMAVERSSRPGGAIGLVYFMGAVGSIVGTFLAGFYLTYHAPTTVILTVVAASLALLAGVFGVDKIGVGLSLGASVWLGLGSYLAAHPWMRLPGVPLGPARVNLITLAGHLMALAAGVRAIAYLRSQARASAVDLGDEPEARLAGIGESIRRWLPGRPRVEDARLSTVRLGDLALLSFVASLAFMAFEMLAGRLVTRHLGSSVYGWTSVIGVLLGGLSLGNFLGGKLADRVTTGRPASWLFLAASLLIVGVLLSESPPGWLVRNPAAHFGSKSVNGVRKVAGEPLFGGSGEALHQAIGMTYGWRPSLSEGWVKFPMPWPARVLFWVSAVFFLPSLALGTVSPLVAKLAVDRVRQTKATGAAIGQVYAWGMVGSILGTFVTGFFLIDALGTKGLALALATVLALAATGLGGVVHAAWAGIPLGLCAIAFVPGSWFEKQGLAWGLREEKGDAKSGVVYVDESNYTYIKVSAEPDADGEKRTLVLDNLIHGYCILDHPERLDYDYEHIYALVTRRVVEAKAKAEGLKDVRRVGLETLFLGGGTYTFPRYLQHEYPRTAADVAEIDPAVTEANHRSLGLSRETTIKTTFGDARQFIDRRLKLPKSPRYDVVFGDAFNDFSVPRHLTTREFNDKVAALMAPNGVYMINIIDIYESDKQAISRGQAEALKAAKARARDAVLKAAGGASKAKAADVDAAEAAARPTPKETEAAVRRTRAEALKIGGFLGSWVETAKLTFPHIYVYGTDATPGTGLRETFVVVASKAPLDLEGLGARPGDPHFGDADSPFQPRAYPDADMRALAIRSRGIRLTDEYAPVENLLAPVAATRGDD